MGANFNLTFGRGIGFYQQKTPTCSGRGDYFIKRNLLNGFALFDSLRSVGLLAAKPIDNCHKCEYDTNPIEPVGNRVNHVFECPLEAIGYRLKDALEVHG
jgi:hypothetical protein